MPRSRRPGDRLLGDLGLKRADVPRGGRADWHSSLERQHPDYPDLLPFAFDFARS
jgi:hypothetical protein